MLNSVTCRSSNSPLLLKPEASLAHSQPPAICQYPEPSRSSPCPHPTSLRPTLILSSHLRLGLPSGLLSSGFATTSLYAPLLYSIQATCPAYLSLLDMITRIIFGEEYRAQSSLLCSLLHSPVTSSLLGPSILLSTLNLRSSSMRATKFHTHTKQQVQKEAVSLNNL